MTGSTRPAQTRGTDSDDERANGHEEYHQAAKYHYFDEDRRRRPAASLGDTTSPSPGPNEEEESSEDHDCPEEADQAEKKPPIPARELHSANRTAAPLPLSGLPRPVVALHAHVSTSVRSGDAQVNGLPRLAPSNLATTPSTNEADSADDGCGRRQHNEPGEEGPDPEQDLGARALGQTGRVPIAGRSGVAGSSIPNQPDAPEHEQKTHEGDGESNPGRAREPGPVHGSTNDPRIDKSLYRPRVSLYARVSTSEQSTDVQVRELTEYAARMGWTVEPELIFRDDAISGVRANRPALDALRVLVRERRVDVILTSKLDRLGRSVIGVLQFYEEADAKGVRVICTSQGFDSGTAAGRFMRDTLAAVAAFERELIVERTHAGLRRARALGKRLGRPPRQVSPEALQRIIELRAERRSWREIAQHVRVPTATVRRVYRRSSTDPNLAPLS